LKVSYIGEGMTINSQYDISPIVK